MRKRGEMRERERRTERRKERREREDGEIGTGRNEGSDGQDDKMAGKLPTLESQLKKKHVNEIQELFDLLDSERSGSVSFEVCRSVKLPGSVL